MMLCSFLGSAITRTRKRDPIIPWPHRRGSLESQYQTPMRVTADDSLICICSLENAVNLCCSHSLGSPLQKKSKIRKHGTQILINQKLNASK